MRRFTTFEGVFTPCLLSILGVIMYLRLGWVVGSVGITRALLIIGLANLITLATALSMSTVVTNIRIGTGGAYSIIRQSLGAEAGGAIGIPLYLSQAISTAFYITGFTECWVSVFTLHDPVVVSVTTWFILLVISYVSARMAFRLQYGIMFIIFLSLLSIFLSHQLPLSASAIWTRGDGAGFWPVFAIFFPAVTGVLAGAAMSGELKDPKRSIPLGTLSAIGVSFLVYVGMAVWLGTHVPANELVANTSILIELGRWPVLVIAGIMGATLSSAMSMFVGSPRTLLALGKHEIVPFSRSLVRISPKGEPVAAILFTSLLVLMTLLFGTLDKVAELLTMFFLITYGMINFTVFVEQAIGIVSFRPTFRVSKFIPFLGALGCLSLIFLVNPVFGLIGLVVIGMIYLLLVRRGVETYSPDVRSGVLLFIAEQMAKMSARLPYHPKMWKPNLLVPVPREGLPEEVAELIKTIAYPSGRTIFTKVIPRGTEHPIVQPEKGKAPQDSQLSDIAAPFREEGMFVETPTVESPDFVTGTVTVMQAVKGMFFPPNTLFCCAGEEEDDGDLGTLLEKGSAEGLGIVVLKYHPEKFFGEKKAINLWIRRQSPNIDLSILIALQLKRNWEGTLRIVQVVDSPGEVEEAGDYLRRMESLMRLPPDIENRVLAGSFREILGRSPGADINIFGMPHQPDIGMIRETFRVTGTSVLFLLDSKHESAVA